MDGSAKDFLKILKKQIQKMKQKINYLKVLEKIELQDEIEKFNYT